MFLPLNEFIHFVRTCLFFCYPLGYWLDWRKKGVGLWCSSFFFFLTYLQEGWFFCCWGKFGEHTICFCFSFPGFIHDSIFFPIRVPCLWKVGNKRTFIYELMSCVRFVWKIFELLTWSSEAFDNEVPGLFLVRFREVAPDFFLRQYEVLRSSAELVLSFCVWFTCVGIMNFASAAYYAALQPQKVDKGIQVSGTVTRLMFLTSYILF